MPKKEKELTMNSLKWIDDYPRGSLIRRRNHYILILPTRGRGSKQYLVIDRNNMHTIVADDIPYSELDNFELLEVDGSICGAIYGLINTIYGE